MKLWMVCRPVVADSHHFHQEQDPDPQLRERQNPDPHENEKLDPDPNYSDAIKTQIRIRIKLSQLLMLLMRADLKTLKTENPDQQFNKFSLTSEPLDGAVRIREGDEQQLILDPDLHLSGGGGSRQAGVGGTHSQRRWRLCYYLQLTSVIKFTG